ncbi:hypothetical protein [Saccharopolyspora flava]|uniref:WXG100 family type VII secretion target n=1 Tax=Saccharopolyspora flava TaxID=95161 RepID=A0A1I6PMU1_9PSEU|nr:hypothetical protein [Saccharopolyspora flava]SFS41365.1 hypothetical protein SAMN05660874_00932 [Saccharopolyspora flava]
MSAVEELRAGISLASEQGRDAVASLDKAISKLETTWKSLAVVTRGAAQDDVMAVPDGLRKSISSLTNARSMIVSSISASECWADRL